MHPPGPSDIQRAYAGYFALPSFDRAAADKFDRGRREHGDIMTDDPLIAAGEELLDFSNYMRAAREAGYVVWSWPYILLARLLWCWLRRLWLKHHDWRVFSAGPRGAAWRWHSQALRVANFVGRFDLCRAGLFARHTWWCPVRVLSVPGRLICRVLGFDWGPGMPSRDPYALWQLRVWAARERAIFERLLRAGARREDALVLGLVDSVAEESILIAECQKMAAGRPMA